MTEGSVHDVNMLDEILPEVGAFYVMDRGYIDFERLYVLTLCSAFFVVRTKQNVLLQRRYSRPVDKSTGVRSDQTVVLTAIDSAKAYPDAPRCLDVSLYQILQILSVTLFEKTPILQALQPSVSEENLLDSANQLRLFDFIAGHY